MNSFPQETHLGTFLSVQQTTVNAEVDQLFSTQEK